MRKSMELKSIWFAPPKLIFAVSIHHSLFLYFCKGFLSDRKVAEKFFEKGIVRSNGMFFNDIL